MMVCLETPSFAPGVACDQPASVHQLLQRVLHRYRLRASICPPTQRTINIGMIQTVSSSG